jgi:hypothetical protein
VRALQELTLVVAILAGTIGGSQVPRFVQEYEQRLGGASQEADRQLAEYRRIAEATGQPFDDYLRQLSGNEDPSVAATGRTITASEARAIDLRAQAEALERAPRLLKPLVLMRRRDPELLRATWSRFEPTLTLDPSFAALGVLFGWLLNALLWGLARRRRRVPRIDAQGQT